TLPAGANFVSAASSQGICSNHNGVVTCTLGALANGAVAAITINAAAVTAGVWTNTASVSSVTGDPVAANNTASTSVSINAFPGISDIADQATNEDTPTPAIGFVVGDAETPATALNLFGTSSDTNLVPHTNIVFGGSGSNRTVTVTP